MIDFPIPASVLQPIIDRALTEDLGDAGDITSLATIPAEAQATATFNARQGVVIAGLDVARMVFTTVDASCRFEPFMGDGTPVAAGSALASVTGPARSILTAERTALNLLCHMGGIATATRALVDAVNGTGTQIACTRKTLPGLRALQKYAVRCGGGRNHRYGLHDAVMIKDNHIIAAGGIAPALERAKAYVGHLTKIEIEVDTLAQLEEVLAHGADVILLDNMSTDDLKRAVQLTNKRAILEASGNVTAQTVRGIAETGVDVISSGWITHSAPQLDIGLDFAQA